ncbi:Ureidoglycolate lyase [Pluralibacter gergoviae]|nr:Ureidoglycolate lyase [Pluralibacter gergoviae]
MTRPGKIICVGLNYADHTKESNYAQPDYPTVFPRFNSSLLAHNQPIILPKLSDTLDYEGELAVVLKSGGRYIDKAQALECVAGYALFNDASVREYQFLTPQWTVGKNFDATGAFGPDLVTADELPPGAAACCWRPGSTVKPCSRPIPATWCLTSPPLSPPSARRSPSKRATRSSPARPPASDSAGIRSAFLKDGDIVEVSVERVGTLRNRICAEK